MSSGKEGRPFSVWKNSSGGARTKPAALSLTTGDEGALRSKSVKLPTKVESSSAA
jgi:hypothetical protein